MELFELKEGVVTYSPVALMLEPFKALWKRDKARNKATAVQELAYVYYYSDYKSDFSDILEKDEKEKEIIRAIFGENSKWKPDEKVYVACDFYRERSETITTKLLENAMSGVHKISTYLSTVDLTEEDDKGRLKHDAKKVADTIGALDKLIDSLSKVEEKVKKERQLKEKMRGSTEKKAFEDGI